MRPGCRAEHYSDRIRNHFIFKHLGGARKIYSFGLLFLVLFKYTFNYMKNIKKKIKTYINKLFDFSFKEFVTLSVIRGLYWINVIIGGVLAALTVSAGFKESVLLGVIALIFSPVVFGVYLIVLRVLFEAVAVVFRISEGVKQISNILENKNQRKTVNKYEVKEKDDRGEE